MLLKTLKPDYFVVGEIKLENSFPSAQLIVHGYETRNQKNKEISL